ncbi:MAG TPA: efflux RND transporter permease subunit [Bdellovibrionota bacterium]|nr:efflux RND transporter permease subunit [Bdellovibrionota bacterium]
MTLSELSVKRPIFISCIAGLILVLGYMSLKSLPVDLFPDVTFPVVLVNTPYPGAGPAEVETLVSKVLEEEMSTLPGIKAISSINRDSLSTVVAEFTLETDVKYAEQQIRDRVGSARHKLPDDIQEPTIRRIDPADQPILILSVEGDLDPAPMYDLANEDIKPRVEQIPQVGLVDVVGGRKREIQVYMDRAKLKSHEVSASQVSQRIAAAGQNIPAGKVNQDTKETVFRTLGEFKTLDDIKKTVVNFLGNDVPVTVADIAEVKDGLEEEKARGYTNGKKALFLYVFRQSGSNTVAVADAVRARVDKINDQIKTRPGNLKITVVRDTSKFIRMNVEDVKESILIGILLTIIVVYFFLGNGRSTLITGAAIPNSLIGAFLLMSLAHFSINIMSLLALSLAVGLLIDDAIVVRENIFRHMELGVQPRKAALQGTAEVTLAVVATTLTVLAVFGPVGFLKGVVGQFFKQFGLTVCFAMVISLFDALAIAPMLSAYLAGGGHGAAKKGVFGGIVRKPVEYFESGQKRLTDWYEGVLKVILRRPGMTLIGATILFFVCMVGAALVPKTFLPAQDAGEFSVSLEMPPGTNLDAMDGVARKVDEVIRGNREVESSVLTVGSREGDSGQATFYITLIPRKNRTMNTSQFKDKVREELKTYAYAKPIVKDVDFAGAGQRPFTLFVTGQELPQIEKTATQLYEKLRTNPALKDVDMDYRPGKPEFQVLVDNRKAEQYGVSTVAAGAELRNLVEGATPAVFRQNGLEYDIRVRLQEDQRDLEKAFGSTYVPNINYALVRLQDVARPIVTSGPATINRRDRGRYIQISADVTPGGAGMGGVMQDIRKWMGNDIPMPPGVGYAFSGQAENFQELMSGMLMAAGLGILFIYMVLASLYESVVTPFTIMLVLPLAAMGAFIALLVTRTSFDMFSMIGCIMLLGLATKNSILLVDYTQRRVAEGMDPKDALIEAGRTRLRPILMTTIALISGMLPIAIGLNEASKQRTSMGIAVIGGLISSTALTLVVVPAAYSYVERFRRWSKKLVTTTFSPGGKAAG